MLSMCDRVSLACTFNLLDYMTLESAEHVLNAARPQNGVTAGCHTLVILPTLSAQRLFV